MKDARDTRRFHSFHHGDTMIRILLIDDDRRLKDSLRERLPAERWETSGGEEAVIAAINEPARQGADET